MSAWAHSYLFYSLGERCFYDRRPAALDLAEGGGKEECSTEGVYMVDGAKFLRMRPSRGGGLGKNEGRSVLKNRDEESLGGPILTSGGSSHSLAFVFSLKMLFCGDSGKLTFGI